MTMTEMLKATMERRDTLQKTKPNRQIKCCGKTFDIDGIGEVWCGLEMAEGATTWMRPYPRRRWKLNGKRISAAKLSQIVGA